MGIISDAKNGIMAKVKRLSHSDSEPLERIATALDKVGQAENSILELGDKLKDARALLEQAESKHQSLLDRTAQLESEAHEKLKQCDKDSPQAQELLEVLEELKGQAEKLQARSMQLKSFKIKFTRLDRRYQKELARCSEKIQAFSDMFEPAEDGPTKEIPLSEFATMVGSAATEVCNVISRVVDSIMAPLGNLVSGISAFIKTMVPFEKALDAIQEKLSGISLDSTHSMRPE